MIRAAQRTTLPLVGLAIGLVAQLPGNALATPGAPDTTFGPAGMRVDTRLPWVGGPNVGDEGFVAIHALTGGGILAQTRARCGMDCRSEVFSRYSRTGVITGGYASHGLLWLGSGTGYLARFDGGVTFGRSDPTLGNAVVTIDPDGRTRREVRVASPQQPMAVLPDGRVLVASLDGSTTLSLLRADGTSDPSFAPVAGSGVIRATDSGVWIAQHASTGVRLLWRPFDATRPHSTRVVVPQVAGGRRRFFAVQRILVDGKGAPTLVGSVTYADGMSRPTSLMRFDATGRLETRFGSHGLLRIGTGNVVAAEQRNGAIVVARTETPSPARVDVVVRRLTPRGAADSAFPTRRLSYVATATFDMDVTIDPYGRTVIGMAALHGRSASLLLIRLRK